MSDMRRTLDQMLEENTVPTLAPGKQGVAERALYEEICRAESSN